MNCPHCATGTMLTDWYGELECHACGRHVLPARIAGLAEQEQQRLDTQGGGPRHLAVDGPRKKAAA